MNRSRCPAISFSANFREFKLTPARKWDCMRTRSIQILKSGALSFSRESSLSSSNTVSFESAGILVVRFGQDALSGRDDRAKDSGPKMNLRPGHVTLLVVT